ncbi:type II secretion system protein M [Sphingomonas sp. BT-65]|uniref:type II secretion system protein M n=1 Tax=Sphingomonas sp. BT-65 TaxID=2989821 RepID=UPI002235FF5B|nr:type II secretion system protein M [Sphingomonas sp. BT-65]MCW4460108.1 type II secretion system protein M [Sphingomonas sp. BT-65]
MSGVRITRSPTLDAWGARLSQWWSGLSSRERWMVGALGAILAALVLVFGIVKPLQAARAEALADIRTYETLTARVRAAGVLTPQGARPQQRSGTPAEAAQAAAGDAGITANVAPGGAGLTAQVAEAPYEAVVGWIADVERTTPLRARRVELRKGGAAGRVSATVEFAQ